MQIRDCQISDLTQIQVIEEACQIAPWTGKIFHEVLEKGFPGWVLEDNKKILGFAFITLNSGECHLINIAIHPQYHRRGFGKALLQYVIDWVKQKKSSMIILEVGKKNLPAIQLYRQFNFKEIGLRKGYYLTSNGAEDALVFALDLQNFFPFSSHSGSL